MTVRLRYAPSPTGHLHIGGARTALWAFLYAKQQGGQFILRIEDTDLERNVEGAASEFAEGLRWLGIEWDEGVEVGGPHAPYRCMERLPIYQKYVEQLIERDLAYRCYCTAEELERDRESQMAEGVLPSYTGRCRHLTAEQQKAYHAAGRPYSIRMRVPSGKTISFQDLIRGDVSFESDGNDFVIVKSNGIPTYNFQVVIDDRLMEITHVTRGEEHLSNTPRQILVYEAFGWTPPHFAHLNLILNQEGKKLSKRDESILQFISQYREMGYLPEAIFNFLALLGWSPGGEQELFSKQELIEQFSFERVNKSGSIFDPDKLNWMNSVYIKQADRNSLTELCIPSLQKAGYLTSDYDPQWVSDLVGLLQEYMTYASQIVQLSRNFFTPDVAWEPEGQEILREPQAEPVLSCFLRLIEESAEWSVDAIKANLKQVQKETGFKGRALFMTIRAALTGSIHGPDLNQSIYLLGKQRVIDRLTQALKQLS